MASTLALVIETPNGNLDLTQYLDVNPGEGLDPADSAFTTKIISHSVLREGGSLALEDLKPKELIYPLKLKASTKDKLTLLVREINIALNTMGAELQWQDEGTTVETYFDVISGQFDTAFNFRMGQQAQPWLTGKLRVFVQPLGQLEKAPRQFLLAGTSAVNGATLTGTLPVQVFTGASGVRGDFAALPNAIIGVTPSLGAGAYSAFSVLPNPSYVPLMMATAANASVTFGGSNFKATRTSAEGSFLVGWSTENDGTKQITFYRGASAYFGANRVLAVARRLNPASPASLQAETEGEYTEQREGKTLGQAVFDSRKVELNGSLWQLADLGVFSRASTQVEPWGITLVSSGTVAIAGLIMLPENSTQWLYEEESKSQVVTFGQAGVIGSGVNGGYLGVQPDRSGIARGALPGLPPGGSPPVLAFLAFDARQPTRSSSASVTVQERSRYVF